MNRRLRVSTVLTALALAACAATPFQPQDDRGYGYAEQKLAPDSYTVMFLGNSATPQAQACDFAALRAAQLGKSQGFTYLRILDDRHGAIMLQNGRANTPAYPENGNPPVSSRMDGGPTMTYGAAAGYGGSLNLGGRISGGMPAYACVLKVQYSDKPGGDARPSAQAIQSLLDDLSAKYALPSTGG